MIESVFEKLVNDEDIAERYNLRSQRITYTPITRHIDGNYGSSRLIFTINSNSIPILVVKFHNDNKFNSLIEKEFNNLRLFYTKYKNLSVPAPVALYKINGLTVMVREAVLGQTLHERLKDRNTVENLQQIVKHANEVQMQLNTNLTPSNFTDFVNEVYKVTFQFIALYEASPLEESVIMKHIKLLVDQFRTKNIYKRYTPGDFSATNILSDGTNTSTIIDFENAEETHLYFLEWFYFINSSNIPSELIKINCNGYYISARDHVLSCYKEGGIFDEPIATACWLLFYMKDFVDSRNLSSHRFGRKRIDLQFKLSALFTGSNRKKLELMRLSRISLFILKTGGIKALYHALIEKVRISGLVRTLTLKTDNW